MRTKLFTMLVLLGIVLSACGPAATSTPQVVTQQVIQTQIVEVTPTAGPNPEAVIQNVEPNATITF